MKYYTIMSWTLPIGDSNSLVLTTWPAKCFKANRKSQKLLFLIEMAENVPSVFSPHSFIPTGVFSNVVKTGQHISLIFKMSLFFLSFHIIFSIVKASGVSVTLMRTWGLHPRFLKNSTVSSQISLFFFFFFFFFFLIWVLWPFQEYFTYIEPIVHQRWVKTREPGENPPDHP